MTNGKKSAETHAQGGIFSFGGRQGNFRMELSLPKERNIAEEDDEGTVRLD